MMGAIIGDVVGSRFEFDNTKTKDFELITSESEYTDDSVLTIAVLDILNSGDYSYGNCVKTMQRWAQKYPFAGYGAKFIEWKDMKYPHPYNSCGNGSAMRVSGVGWFAKSEEEVIKLSRAVTEITHNHPEGIKGAEVTAMCVYKALHGASKEEIREYALSKYPEVENLNFELLKTSYVYGPTICQLTLPQALYCFLISNSFEDCLRTTVSLGGDTDTTAAISCAIAEAFYKEIDPKLINQVKNKLTKEMLDVIDLATKNAKKIGN